VELQMFCAECAVRPEVDYLEAYRLQYWGKRDSWAWLYGVGGLLNFLIGLAMAADSLGRPEALAEAAVLLLSGVNSVLFWLGFRVARLGAVLGILAAGMIHVVANGAQGLAATVLPLIITLSVISSTRNKLFFKLDVSRSELRKSWDTFHNNTIARSASTLGVAGLLIPVFAPFAIGCGIVGLRRVNPNALPPIGNKRRAVAGIVLGVVGLVLWTGLLVLMWASKS
jgi:hypothetical protein